jgi:RecB family endonuclease NucS
MTLRNPRKVAKRHRIVRNGQYGPPAMRLRVARCEVTYTGRLTARLAEAVRLLMFKADGSVLVHDDSGGYKPLNRIRREFRPRAV